MTDVLLAAPPPTPDSLARVIWLFGVLLALVIGLLITVTLTMRMVRRRHPPAPPRKPDQHRDPWLEAGRRLDAEHE